ncbi:type I-E CRISPR-associated protein Cas6/Cse3/CasE [Streptacidiphilus sp. EB129]|uniref:type I-E CRISPR-associated protein Cas6/Cse3/CasE n=1 Tax=Streptacidiphilus sp. EB129 TaxID=3156262 RepID=UPI003514F0B7
MNVNGEALSVYLSRIALDPRRRWTAGILRNSQAAHAFTMTPFTGTRADNHVLHHIDSRAGQEPVLLVQSVRLPDWDRLNPALGAHPTVKDVTRFHLSLRAGQTMRFRLVAAPTRSSPDGFPERERGTKLPLHDATEQAAWFTRRTAHACRVDTLTVQPHTKRLGWKSSSRPGDNAPGTKAGSRTITHNQVAFTGTLTIRDPDELRTLAVFGIGPGKAYGCGLLALAHTAAPPRTRLDHPVPPD